MLGKLDFSKLTYNAQTALMKVPFFIDPYKNVMVSVSGGSDSDVVIDMIVRMVKDKSKLHFVFFDTGLEYKATKSHLDYLETTYGIEIERMKAIKPIPVVAKTYGQPFISKHVSEMCYRLQKYGFEWSDASYQSLVSYYPNCESALKWFTNSYDKGSAFNIDRNRLLRQFMIENPPQFKISAKCCDYAKKKVAEKYKEDNKVDLSITGLRRAEGGVRSTRYSSCFSEKEGCSEFRPLWNLTDDDKANYCNVAQIRHSDCYEKYGLLRTGCIGCPMGRECNTELDIVRQFEPSIYRAVANVFKDSYEYTAKYRQFIIDNS